MENKSPLYIELKALADALNAKWKALNKMNGVAVEQWNSDHNELTSRIENYDEGDLPEKDKVDLYDLLDVPYINSNEVSVAASERKTRRTRKSRKARKSRKSRKARKARKVRKTRKSRKSRKTRNV